MILLSDHGDLMAALHPDYPTPIPALNELYEGHLERVVEMFQVKVTRENRVGLARDLRKAADLLEEAHHFDTKISKGHPRVRINQKEAASLIDAALEQARMSVPTDRSGQ